MTLYITAEAAAELGVAHSTITLHARKCGFTKRGHDYLFTRTHLKALRASMDERGPGRPRKIRKP